MAEPVGDLVVDLSLDAARFDEQMARVRRHFSGTESDAKKTAAVVEQSLSRQALAAQKAGISVGQYKAAMRMLPAQFTDVATQLAGGQSPWLILLQQGGQVKDSFGGMIPMFRGLAGAITLPMVGPPRWRWRPVRWRMPGIRATQPCPISTKRWSFPAIRRD
ncbi:phage tail tape measure, lambda family domain protein [Escherichia coli DEC11B]|nr:phage tail tape measure, lambda family domain protein [Escherichia coli DEC11B]